MQHGTSKIREAETRTIKNTGNTLHQQSWHMIMLAWCKRKLPNAKTKTDSIESNINDN